MGVVGCRCFGFRGSVAPMWVFWGFFVGHLCGFSGFGATWRLVDRGHLLISGFLRG